MTTVIKKSNFKSFLGSLCIAVFILALGGLFICAPFLDLFSEVGRFFSILLLVGGVVTCIIALGQFKSSLAFLGVKVVDGVSKSQMKS